LTWPPYLGNKCRRMLRMMVRRSRLVVFDCSTIKLLNWRAGKERKKRAEKESGRREKRREHRREHTTEEDQYFGLCTLGKWASGQVGKWASGHVCVHVCACVCKCVCKWGSSFLRFHADRRQCLGSERLCQASTQFQGRGGGQMSSRCRRTV
jgi:hypothetical protein